MVAMWCAIRATKIHIFPLVCKKHRKILLPSPLPRQTGDVPFYSMKPPFFRSFYYRKQ